MLRIFCTLLVAALLSSVAHSKTLLEDHFSGKAGSKANANKWVGEYHKQGQGKFTGVGRRTGRGTINLGVNKKNFDQKIIRSKQFFSPGKGKIVAEARIKINHNQGGIVHGFFFYDQYTSDKRLKSDELDFEWLTKRIKGKKDVIHLTTWNRWDRKHAKYSVWNSDKYGTHAHTSKGTGKQLNHQWHVYKMIWRKGRVQFFIDNKQIHEWKGAGVPTRKMRLFLNAWVPDSTWADAYDKNFEKGKSGWANMEVDWIKVSN